nr:peroxide stress protein YaaA [uncultured Marvinbryantia sp.]
MKIIISPAKKMRVDTDTLEGRTLPEFIKETTEIMHWLQKLTYDEAKKLWECNDGIASLNYKRLREMDLERNLTPAILSYEGIQYQYMAPAVFSDGELDYIQENLRILSGFYGVLKPMDGVVPYRLEMQAKAAVNGTESLYDFWAKRLYRAVLDESRIIINLASREYAKIIERYLQPEDRFLTCIFGEMQSGRVVQKGTMAKMARGEMVRYMAENRVENPEQMKAFCGLGYCFSQELSTTEVYTFLKSEDKKAGSNQGGKKV